MTNEKNEAAPKLAKNTQNAGAPASVQADRGDPNRPQKQSLRTTMAKTNQAMKDNQKTLVVDGVKGGVQGGKVGGKLASIVPGAGTLAGTAAGAAVGGSLSQAKVGRESGDPGLAYLTAAPVGGVAGGLVNAHLAKKYGNIEPTEPSAGSTEKSETAKPRKSLKGAETEQVKRRRRVQRQRVHRHQAGVNRLEQTIEHADPDSQKGLAKIDKARDKVHLTGAEDKSVNKLESQALAGGMAAGAGESDAVNAFAKGFAGGVTHMGKQKYSAAKAQQQKAEQTKGLPSSAEVAGGFGYVSEAEQANWSQQRDEAGVVQRQSVEDAVKERSAEIKRERAGLETERTQMKAVTYTPSIPIEDEAQEQAKTDIGMER